MTRRFGRFLRRNTIALLALFVALSGTTFAAANIILPKNSVGTAQIKNGAVTKKKINKKTVRALKGNRGSVGPKGPTGPQGLKGDKGDKGATGAAGSALAFAGVHADGTLFTQAGLAKNITAANISHPGMGVYCFHGLPFTPQTAVGSGANGFGLNFTLVTVEISGRDGNTFSADCVATDQARVRTVVVPGSSASTLTDEPFYVWFD